MNYLDFDIINLVYMNLHLNISQVQRTTPQEFLIYSVWGLT